MYRLGERKHSRRKLYAWLGGFLVLLFAGAIVAVYLLHADTVISQTPAPVVRRLTYAAPKTTVYEGATFKISLPEGWKTMAVTDMPTPTYTWHGTGKTDGNRWLDVYVDADLTTLSLNRAVSVAAHGNGVSATSDVSDNCASFIGNAKPAPHQTYVPAKWHDLPFLCETGTYARDVVGTVSADGLNNVTISGPASGKHHYMFTYTDNSASPDYKVFTDALQTFQAK
ncbi:MAG TPA: hypothetical protein VFH39_00125 [Candidatus Saccharimonadales bacterium]|nr:hypothetical protein [Candidatus Saccharimonadales bacterium]